MQVLQRKQAGRIKMSVIKLKDYTDSSPYKEMYLKMVRAARDAEKTHRKADQILIEAMQKCEEMYINANEPKDTENNKDTQ